MNCPYTMFLIEKKFLYIKLERTINMEEKKKIVVVARTEGIEIIVEGEKDTDDYELLLSKTQAMELAMSILNTLYKTGIKM
jgi:intracellular sulfur oxidation DsrE/DsrF family protein